MAAKRLTSSDAAAMLELQLMVRAFDTDNSREIDKGELQGMMKQLLGDSGNLQELDEMVCAPHQTNPRFHCHPTNPMFRPQSIVYRCTISRVIPSIGDSSRMITHELLER
jgi:hypothetical protein